jgi:5-methylcytosine-specific restriction endonuclease McrA
MRTRIREFTIHREFFFDEVLAECTPHARLYYLHLWAHSQDDGSVPEQFVVDSEREWPRELANELLRVGRLKAGNAGLFTVVDRHSPYSDPIVSHVHYRQYAKNRRARKLNAAVCDFTLSQWTALVESECGRCVYCHEASDNLTQEHMVPLVRGGSHTLSNIAPACKRCNNRKGTKTPLEFVFGLRVKNGRMVCP